MINYNKEGRTKDVARGFTLMELLVAIAIVAILSGISIFALGGARQAARDGRRKADLETIRGALEIYRADCNVYPNPWTPTAGSTLSASCSGSTNTYLESVPGDPSGSNYYYSTTGVRFDICAQLEQAPSTPMTCSGCPTCNWRVSSL